MTNYVVDRCYDRYIITMARDEGERSDAQEGFCVKLISDMLLSVLDERLQMGCLRSCRINAENDCLSIDAEAASGYEEWLAAAVDTATTGMTLLAERYPDAVAVEC